MTRARRPSFERRTNFVEQGKQEIISATTAKASQASSSKGVSMFQVKVSSDEERLDGTLEVRGLIDNARCLEPVPKMELSLIRVLKYRTDVHSGERIQRKRLLNVIAKGAPPKHKDGDFVRILDGCLEKIFPIADANNFTGLSLEQVTPFLSLVPTCVSQNFICYYQVEVRSHHGDKKVGFKPTKIEFELFLDVSSKVIAFLEKRKNQTL